MERADVSKPPFPIVVDGLYVFVPVIGSQFDEPLISNVRIKQQLDASLTPEAGIPAAIQALPLYVIE
jgi:hypothetical protein